jgi:release factor glutamine methyltransferase
MMGLPASSAETCAQAGDACEATRVLPAFTEVLSEVGYLDFVTTFNPFALRQEAFAAARESAPPTLVTLIDLFLLSRPVSSSRTKDLLGDAFGTLVGLRLLRTSEDDIVVMPNLVLLNVLGCWIFAQQQQIAPMLYFGDDSFGLMYRILGHTKGRCLDLCCGPGAQTLVLATRAPSVIGVDINPAAIALAQINILMNGLAGKAEARVGDLYSAVPDEKFDTIVANPPLLPVPPGLKYPFVGNGGHDGFRVTARILKELPSALALDGTAHIVGTSLGDGLSAHVEDELDRWARKHQLHVLMTQICVVPLAPKTQMFDGLVATICGYSGIPREEASSVYSDWLQSQSATHLVTFFLSVTHNGVGLDVMDFGSVFPATSLWFV